MLKGILGIMKIWNQFQPHNLIVADTESQNIYGSMIILFMEHNFKRVNNDSNETHWKANVSDYEV